MAASESGADGQIDQASHVPILRCTRNRAMGAPVTATDQKGLGSRNAVIEPIDGRARNATPAIRSN